MITCAGAHRNGALSRALTRLIIGGVLRRLHVREIFAGEVPLEDSQARHARDSLRLSEGTIVEVFDDGGSVAAGPLIFRGPHGAAVQIEKMARAARPTGCHIIVASAVPKGERADWMVEKLSELGVAAFIPLAAARSVALPRGTNKHQRWVRIATESAKQARRVGTMQVAQVTDVSEAIRESVERGGERLLLSLAPEAMPIRELKADPRGNVTLFVGPEGGWTDAELDLFAGATVLAVRLTNTVLRVETAAVAAAAVIASLTG